MKVNAINKYDRTVHELWAIVREKITTVKDKNYISKAIQILLLKLLTISFTEDIFQKLYSWIDINERFQSI